MRETKASAATREAFLRQIAPYFPVVDDAERELRAIEAKHSAPEDWLTRHLVAAESLYLPYWHRLAAAYTAALELPGWGDDDTWRVEVEVWPESLQEQQRVLHDLLAVSKLRQAWRGDCAWSATQRTYITDTQREVVAALERHLRAENQPLREIPLYQGWMRVSCQQVVTMPADTWLAMQSTTSHYQPERVDPARVERVATRLARAFNVPPLADFEHLNAGPAVDEPVVWRQSARGLTAAINCHGIRDRMDDQRGLPGGNSTSAAQSLPFPQWRYEGFVGQLRVHGLADVPWLVCVLAPLHFLRRLHYYRGWFNGAR